jgi:two-component system, OmpR family, sensor histidine kinase CreC
MSLRRRLFITVALVLTLGFLGIAQWIRGEMRISHSQSVEEILVDASHLVSAWIEERGMSPQSMKELGSALQRYKNHPIRAPIQSFNKTSSTLDFYVTDRTGKVIYSSKPEEIGRDFSQWNDVHRTLRGEYGARSTRTDPNDPKSSIHYVAAPIKIQDQISGVVSIYKTERSTLLFLDRALNRMFTGAVLAVLALVIFGGLILLWITFPLERLRQYAIQVSEGHRAPAPQSGIKEIRHLTDAFEKMRTALEGKKTIEKYTQSLTHEMKSPLTAIKGAAEICLEEIDSSQRKMFLSNIIEETNRSHAILEKLLKIASLEAKTGLDSPENFHLLECLQQVQGSLMGFWKPKDIRIEIQGQAELLAFGERFLLFQSFKNIIQNAIEFSPEKSIIQISFGKNDEWIEIGFIDQGSGIPTFALEKVFDKFFSLERPSTKSKSTGLGLSFVKEVIELHKGRIIIQSPIADNRGTRVQILLPNTILSNF